MFRRPFNNVKDKLYYNGQLIYSQTQVNVKHNWMLIYGQYDRISLTLEYILQSCEYIAT